MRISKVGLSVALIATTVLVWISIGHVSMSENDTYAQEVRTVSYDRITLDENAFDEFDNHEVLQNENGINIKADKSFDMSLLEEFDLVGLDESAEQFTVSYEIDYIAEQDTVFLTATLIGADNIPIIDTVPGLVSINEKGETDILFAVEDELLWLSDLNDSSAINNTGWFSSFIKKITNTVVKTASAIIRAMESIIKPAVRLATYFAVKLLGPDLAAYLGATVLNMSADENGIYHANFNCWQQYFGYTDLYDVVFDSATSMRYAKYEFDVNNDNYTDYILWAWKGNYLNLGAGAELGIYERWEYSDEIWKVDKSNAMKMTLKLEHKKKGLLFDWRPTAKQWWITGFDSKTPNVYRDDLTATFSVEFTNTNMYNCFKNQWQKKDNRWSYKTYMKPVLTL